MAPSFSDIVEETRLTARALLDYGEHFFNPTVRLGVTGLSRAGKTVFITALIHGLTRGGRFPMFEALASGRIARAHLAPQPDDAVPRFDYETHLHTLIEERRWPNSTVDISELRLVVDYQRRNGADRTLTIDIVDYPGEWLLDLPLLNKSYGQWARKSLILSREKPRAHLAEQWLAHLATLSPEEREDEQATRTAARLFTEYLRACRDERFAMSLLPPGRFLMPGNLASSPALTFAPLDVPEDGTAPEGSLAAFNSGPEALHDLEAALAGILDCFRIGRSTIISTLFRPRIDRILFAATKADHLHHLSHDRLEAVLRRAVTRAVARAEATGADIEVAAISAVRATREAMVARGRDKLPSILGTPIPGETADGETFDGNTEVATFPGDLPADPEALFKGEDAFKGLSGATADKSDFRFLRFRPPLLEPDSSGEPALPHIRLDKALQFLIGDRLQ